jgi:hypothetical protein
MVMTMQTRPFLRAIEKDPPIIATHQLIIIVGYSRYVLDISTRYTKLKPSHAEVIPINRQRKKGAQPPTPEYAECCRALKRFS